VAVGATFCNGLYIKFVLRAFGVDLHMKEWLSLTVATSVLNYLIPLRGGMAMRAVYLKARYRFSYTDFVSSLSAMYLMYVVVYGPIGIVGTAGACLAGRGFDVPLTVFFLISTAAAAILMLCRLRMPAWDVYPFRHIRRVLEGWALLRRNRSAFAVLILLTVCFALLSLLEVKIASTAIGLRLPWSGIMLYTAGQNLALLASITPVALGVAEMVSIYMGPALGYHVPQALMVQALLRVVPLTLLLATAVPAFQVLSRRRQECPSSVPESTVGSVPAGGEGRTSW
jgi:uncharacterized membrane protein YbhN (UPF0104 family)